jgi:hypothetical protein
MYPDEVIAKLGNNSISGGVFAPRNRIFCTGHDNPEIYVLRFPQGGSTLLLEDTFEVPNRGQGIALDPSAPDALYSIDRANREVIVARVRRGRAGLHPAAQGLGASRPGESSSEISTPPRRRLLTYSWYLTSRR